MCGQLVSIQKVTLSHQRPGYPRGNLSQVSLKQVNGNTGAIPEVAITVIPRHADHLETCLTTSPGLASYQARRLMVSRLQGLRGPTRGRMPLPSPRRGSYAPQ